ncbi:MAG TPA: LytTR family DNA-binding domain-containing protein [Flavisolibacter sp.]|nr:LytTR family DNA-binding domain-containing protein [Flavisolibacter sp.]
MKIAIIEDEKLTAKDLKRTLMEVDPDAEIVAMLHSVEDAKTFFAGNEEADLIFSDIQLGDGLSFEVFKELSRPVPIIFCTAYDHYLLEAFQSTGIDYILKPFKKDTIEKALGKYQSLQKGFTRNKPNYSDLLNALEAKLAPKKTAVIVRHREKIIPLDASGIALLFVDNGCTYAYTFDQKKFIVNENLEDLERSFSPQFFRANRQHLVNRKAIKDASHFFNRKIVVNLTIPFKEQILVGKLKVTSFIEWLSQI